MAYKYNPHTIKLNFGAEEVFKDLNSLSYIYVGSLLFFNYLPFNGPTSTFEKSFSKLFCSIILIHFTFYFES